ncbi:MFS transporter [Legionella sp. PC1000]|uniref:peptide MFS transporter n=1 Tax=Legionella sp. PC1000 TaxID=2746060 RepID=UPI0015F9846E|nr:oligopeptide:H+ symporter [Legionella sp. PC1000]QLZ68978.1 MFS transporter [Legionella sp. PC1000]
MFSKSQRMPQGVTSLYFIQAFSTFSFAVLYSSLSLYINKKLGFSQTTSNSIVGLFLAFNYVLHLLGGVIGGKYLSNRSLFLITTIIQTFGLLVLSLANESLLYIGLSLFLIGCGLNTTCYNTLLSQLFGPDDSRRDKAFFLSYAAMNVGFLSGFITSGFYDYSNNYQHLFYISSVANILTVLTLIFCWRNLKDKELRGFINSREKLRTNITSVWVILLLIPLLVLCFHSSYLSNSLVIITSLGMLLIILTLGLRQKNREDKQKIFIYLILATTSIIFWMIYYTGPMGIILFIKNNVDKKIFNYEIATQWILNINAVIIIFGAPVLSILINKFKNRGYNFSTSTQFASAFFILALSFLCLAFAVIFSNNQGFSRLFWVILHFTAITFAELLIGPVGYAMIGRIAPIQLQGILMGTWMMVSGVSASLSQYISNKMVHTQVTDPLITNPDYLHVFYQLGIWALAGGIFLLIIDRKIKNLLDEPLPSKVINDSVVQI